VTQPGGAWAVAGYSEGGFCAANMALHYPHRYGFAGVLSGYFEPMSNKLDGSGRLVSPFGGNSRLRTENTPLAELISRPRAAVIPRFWLAAGAGDGQDVAGADRFWHTLRPRQPDVPLTLTPGTGHTMTTWRAEIPSMLTWMTPALTQAAHHHPAVEPARTAVLAATGPRR
jgi:enterochelin esterase-like enzyme